MEEEGARRRAQKGGANRGFLQNLNESDEEEEDLPRAILTKQPLAGAGVGAGAGAGAKVAAQRAVQDTQSHAYDGRAGQRDRGRRTGGSKPFELDLEGATLLGRRHKRGVDGGVVGGAALGLGASPLANKVPQDEPMETPLSPMRVD